MSRVDWAAVRATLAQRPGIVAAWAFGSAQAGEQRPGGDVDVAVLFAQPPTLDERADLRADLQEATGVDEIDLVTLNGASPVLCFEAVSGVRLLCREEAKCASFVSLAAREYEDEAALAERGLRYWKEGRQP